MSDSKILAHVIHESTEEVKEFKVIGENNGKPIGEGYLQTDLNDKNRNGRIYGTRQIKAEVEGDRIQKELIPTGNMKGQDGHPSDPSMVVQQSIDPKLCSVKYTKIWMDGDNVKARFCGTNTIYGKAFTEDLLEGEMPSFSLRAIGAVSQKGGAIYVDGVKIVTWDRVYYPSHKRAYMSSLVTESAAIQEAVSLAESSTDAYNNNGKGILLPITTDSVRRFIKEESANVHKIMESFDMIFESMSLIDNHRSVQMVCKNGDVMIMPLEKYVTNQIFDYCKNA